MEKEGIMIPFKRANILLPKKGTDMTKWSVVACDQYTSEPEYWNEVENIVGEAPSTLRLTLPEIFLEEKDVADRIRDTLDAYNEIIPTVLEIPSKQHPYSIEKDSIMQKALRQLYGQNIPDELKNN